MYAAEPTTANGESLHGHLVDADLEQDDQILTLARELIAAAGPAAMAPGSVAAQVINVTNTHGGTGFIGGQHVPTTTLYRQWLKSAGRCFGWPVPATAVRNTGTGTAVGVTITANVNLAWPSPPDRDIPPGSSVMFTHDPVFSHSSPS